jgi:hypothetical protein
MTAKARILKSRGNRTTCTKHDLQEPGEERQAQSPEVPHVCRYRAPSRKKTKAVTGDTFCIFRHYCVRARVRK